MKRRFQYSSIFAALWVGLLLSFSACSPATTLHTPYLSTISIMPTSEIILNVGDTQQFSTTGHYSDKSTSDVTSKVNWDSTDTNVMTVSSSGLVTAVSPGEAHIISSIPQAGSATVLSSPAIFMVVDTPVSGPTVDVTLEDFKITLGQISIPAGTVKFRIQSNGPNEHEFVIFKTDLAPDKLPMQGNQVNEDAPELTKIDEHEEIRAAQTVFLIVDLTPGNYVAICNVPHHYMHGMHVAFTVE